MEELKSVININHYGCVSVHLRELMDEKGVSRYRLAKMADTRFEVVDKWYAGTVDRIDTDLLSRFCYILNCDVSDILKYNQ